jgi:hypothetical protein
MPPGTSYRLGPLNPSPKIMKFGNQPVHFLNALRQSLFTTTHYASLTKRPGVRCMAMTCSAAMKIPMPGKYCSLKGECRKPMPKASWQGSQTSRLKKRLRAELNRADVRSGARLAAKRKSLARNHKTGRGCSGNASALPRYCTRGQANVIWQNRTMTRDDLLVWLSLAGLFASYCATIWVLFPL